MAFVKKVWKDRLVEFAGRRKLTRVSGDLDTSLIVDVERAEGEISQEGDPFSKSNMDDLEQRIENGFSDLGGCSFVQEGEDFYITGTDGIKKKLGSGTITKLGAKAVSIPVIEAAGGAQGSVTWTVPQGTKAEQILVYIESYSVSAGATNGSFSSSLTYSLSGTTLTATVFGKRLDITVIPVLNAIIVS